MIMSLVLMVRGIRSLPPFVNGAIESKGFAMSSLEAFRIA